MKQYKDYEVEDFLLDDEFAQWVRDGSAITGTRWDELLTTYPEKKADLEEARAYLVQVQTGSSLSDTELTQEIQRILASTTPVVEVPVRYLNSRATWWQVAAAVVLLAGVSWGIWQGLKPTPTYAYEQVIESSNLPLTEVNNSQNKAQPVTLPDGSRITLAGHSRLSYARDMTKRSEREVFLTGEAFFEVTKNPRQPFLVYADGLTTRVVGTSFTIRTGSKQVSVLVRTGRVAVYPMHESGSAQHSESHLMLTPNQQATYLTEANQLTPTIVADPHALQSESQPVSFNFDNTPISEVFARLEKAYGLTIQYDKVTMQNCQLTVPLRDEPFFTKLNIICQTIGASYKVDGTQITISSEGCK
ncbi:FecR family protein [Spirosoma endbachense]|uniref:DUF4974 domain-containing protein n=1 Tax=Spirosoma endbachense TaxID=2666025 RepID=A0A6P1VSG6_9BACT|nr:FecR family protein [Spirosoma endbachense]QHV94306.1 DUF4974 domain-containing protein [Spirosoma endbachense]